MAWAFSWIISSLIARYSRAESMISGRVGSTICLGLADPVLLGLGLGGLGVDRPSSPPCTRSLGTVTSSAPSRLLDLLGRAGGGRAVRRARRRGCGSASARPARAAGRPPGRARSSRCVGRSMTFLPCLCHCGKYIQPWPLKGCENSAVGRPTSISLPSTGASPPWPERWIEQHARRPPAASRPPWSTLAGGIRSPPTNFTSPSFFSRSAKYLLELGELLGGTGQVDVAGAAGIDLVDLGRGQLGPVGRSGRQGPGSQHPGGADSAARSGGSEEGASSESEVFHGISRGTRLRPGTPRGRRREELRGRPKPAGVCVQGAFMRRCLR